MVILLRNLQLDQYSIHLINLDPTFGHEIKKTRPCVIISPNEMNKTIKTILIAPMTTKSHKYPSRISLKFQGKKGWIMLDQMRSVDRLRCVKFLGKITDSTIIKVKDFLFQMLVENN